MKTDEEIQAWVGLGSNAGDSAAILSHALDRLGTLSKRPIRVSSFWRSAPVDCPPGSADFINTVAEVFVDGAMDPWQMLAFLQETERAHGRVRTGRNRPRTLDLDLIAFGAWVIEEEGLILPHGRARERRFVLEPMNELAPEYRFPGDTLTVGELLEGLPEGQEIERLGPGRPFSEEK